MPEHLTAGGTIRKLWIGEASLYCAHLLRLDPESRRNRFGGTVSDDYIRSFAQPANLSDSVVHGFFVDGALRGVSELRPFREHEAETALSVEKEWQGHGVGTVLLERTLLTARNRGIKLLHMMCLVENRRMRQLARKFHANLEVGFGIVAAKLEAPGPAPSSLMRELLTDAAGFVAAFLDAQTRLLNTTDKKVARSSRRDFTKRTAQ